MGAGIALEFSNRFPELRQYFGSRVTHENLPILFHNPSIIGPKHIWSFPTKHHWKNPSDISLIVQSAKYLQAHLKTSICLCSLPGCGNGGLTWKEVSQKLSFLDARFVFVSATF